MSMAICWDFIVQQTRSEVRGPGMERVNQCSKAHAWQSVIPATATDVQEWRFMPAPLERRR